MENKFNANGQIVYVDPQWVTGETCLFTIHDRYDYMKGKVGLTKIRTEFLKKLEADGFVITHDKHNTVDDIVYLNMNDEALVMNQRDCINFKKKFDQKMLTAGGSKLNFPYSVPMEEYFRNPFLPAVFKNEINNGGKDKFLIETPDQIAKLKKFYDRFKNHPKYNIIFNLSIFQQVINTPTEHKTYMRVLMSASGDVLGASLKYSKASKEKIEPRTPMEELFWNPRSEYYLGDNGMFNYYSGGGNINLDSTHITFSEREILKAHGIDPDDPKVPADVLEVSAAIASKCNKELGIMCGIDFIMDSKDNKWYYLENQAFPAIDEWAFRRNKRIPVYKGINDYVKLNALDLEARYEALMLYMAKKQHLSKEDVLKRILETK